MKELKSNDLKATELEAEPETRLRFLNFNSCCFLQHTAHIHTLACLKIRAPLQKPGSTLRKQPLLKRENWDFPLPGAYTFGQTAGDDP